MQKIGGLFQGVGAVRDHDAPHFGPPLSRLQGIQQCKPIAEVQILAIDLQHLLRLDAVARDTRHRGRQGSNGQLGGLIAAARGRRIGQARDRPAGAQNQDHGALLWHVMGSWLKIQILTNSQAGAFVQNSPKLTARQQQIFDLVKDAIEQTGAPPTRAEIAAELGFKSANAAEEHLQALARKGVIELLGGTSRGIRLKSDTLRAVNRARRQEQPSLPLPGIAQLLLPLVGRVAAGSPILAQEHVEQTYAVEQSMFARRPDYLLRIKGMSMRDVGMLDGDPLAVQSTREARNGQIVVARLGDEVTVKRFKRSGAVIELLPENPDFQPIPWVQQGSEPFAIEGLAVGLIRTGGFD